MKKFLLSFISILLFSFLIVNNKTNAQVEEFPNFIMKTRYNTFEYVQENTNTHEFYIYYRVLDIQFSTLSEEEYFIVNDIGISFKKGIDRSTNSYILLEVSPNTTFNYTTIKLHVTITKSLMMVYGYPPSMNDSILRIFNDVTALYIKYISSTGSIDYDVGYSNGYDYGYYNGNNDGYDRGYDIGYDEGYDYGYDVGYDYGYDVGYDDGLESDENEAYQRGHETGYEDGVNSTLGKFASNFHIWIIPAIILVFAIGVFISYKKGRE